MVQVREVIRRWQAGENKTAIGRASGISRRTVGRYIEAAQSLGVAQGGEPPGEGVLAQLLQRNHAGPLPSRTGPVTVVLTGHEARLAQWLNEERLKLSRIHELLAQDGVAVSYTTLRRYVRQAGLWKVAKTTVRMALWPAGEVAEMDFGRLGSIVDAATGKKQTIWALVIVLPYSRHQFVWPLLQQTLEESIGGLERGWRFFGGVPRRLILDNFAAAIAGPDALQPRPTRGFLEYSQERGFLIDAARVRRPKDKPHVERSIQYVRERFFKGASFRDLEDCRQQAERWCSEVAGLRVHGTTRQLPRTVFEAEERRTLQPYDGVIYDVPQWKEVRCIPTITSASDRRSTRYLQRPVRRGRSWRYGATGPGEALQEGRTGEGAPRQPRGGRATDPDDYPAEKTAYALRAPDRIVHRACELGPNVEVFATKLFEGPLPWAKMRQGQKLLSLGEKYSAARLDAACARALSFELVDVRRLHNILLRALDTEERPVEEATVPLGSRFARPPGAFDHRQQRLVEATA
ncbi:MAG: IS21 family transposase [Dehalococcoidia bacterium]|uniref:IS21 family transposase n=1 Tax=Candidatus Amarobacter glycogenicus TaxID=3140699 RepID=UPI0031358386|nr:IS21 family transposase [Dehalococcoidia bacterium]